MGKLNRQKRIRKKIGYVSDLPRLSVYRSNKYVYGQIIDKGGNTILSVSQKTLGKKAGTNIESAAQLGRELAKKALDKKITAIVFDKGRFTYHGRVKALADGAREGGLKF